MRALSLLKAAILQHGTKIGSLDGSRIFRSGGSTYLVQLEYSSGDLFMLFPQTVFYKIEDDKLSEFVGDLVKLVEKRRLE